MGVTQDTTDYYRYCSGEEQIKISNAVCRGRRKASFPKCRGCQYNDDENEKGEGLAPVTRAKVAPTVESAFQTHEVCATTPTPLSVDTAWRIGHAVAQYLRGKLRGYDRADPNARSIVVGRDARPPSALLQQSLIDGIRASGMTALNIGMTDTPQLYFAVSRTQACGGIQTTGGHMPADYNGFKICGTKGAPISLETGLASIRDIAARVPKHQTGTTARLIEQDLAEPYRDFVRSVLRNPARLRRPLKVVADASNGVAGHWLPILFGRIRNLSIVPLNFEPNDRFAHDPDPIVARNTRELRRAVREKKADLGVCFDGDAARCAFVDEKGTSVGSDLITALLARQFIEREPGAAIIYDVRCSRNLVEEIKRAGAAPVRERAGHPHIKRCMAQRNAVFGGDLDGRYYFRAAAYCESAFLAFAQVLNLLCDTRRGLSELARPLQRYRSTGEVVFECPDPERALADVAAAHADAEIDQLDGITVRYPDWWFNVRPDGRRPALRVVLECRTKKQADERLAALQPILATPVSVQ